MDVGPGQRPDNAETLRPWLSRWHVDSPADARRERLPFEGRVLVGALNVCDIQVDDDYLSGRHLELQMHGGFVAFRDNRSTNGTLLNGKPSHSGELADGDTLRIGDTCLQVLYPRASRATTPRPRRVAGPRVDAKFDEVRAAVFRIYTENDDNLVRFQRTHLDELLDEKLGVNRRHARRLLDEFAKHLGVPSEVQRSERWQMVGNLCVGREPNYKLR